MTKSNETLVRALRQATAALEEAEVPEDLRTIAFDKAFDHLTGGGATAASGRASTPESPLVPENKTTSAQNPIERIAAKVNVDPGLADRVYDVDDDGVHLTLPRSSLNEKKRFAMQEVARLIMAGRQAIELEEFTPSKVIREACDGRGVLDAGNFAAALSALDGHGMRLRGSGVSREAKLNAAGFEAAGADIKRILGAP
jgi:hypothetical protein